MARRSPYGFARVVGGAASGLFLSVLFVCTSPPPVVADSLHTPPVGSAERKAILEAFRQSGQDKNRVFIVRTLKVQNGWAWLTVDPRSKDGKNTYEPESVLMHDEGKGWKWAAAPCAEADCEMGAEIKKIRAAFPAAPAAVFSK